MEKDEQVRIDGIDEYYQPVERLDFIISIIFWISAIVSILILYIGAIPWETLRNAIKILFILSVITHVTFTIYLRFILIPTAEEKRRKQLLSDSFGVPLSPEQTKKYYNNELSPSIKRLGTNILENSLYAKSICGRMAVQERIKIFVYFSIWIVALFWRQTSMDFLIVITQTIFSGDIISRLVGLELLRHKNEDLFNELYHEFLHQIDCDGPSGTACILDAFASYESAKAVSSIKQSTKIFNKLNPTLIKKWAQIRSQLGIDEEEHGN